MYRLHTYHHHIATYRTILIAQQDCAGRKKYLTCFNWIGTTANSCSRPAAMITLFSFFLSLVPFNEAAGRIRSISSALGPVNRDKRPGNRHQQQRQQPKRYSIKRHQTWLVPLPFDRTQISRERCCSDRGCVRVSVKSLTMLAKG